MVLEKVTDNDELIFKKTNSKNKKYTLQASDLAAPDEFFFIHIEPINNKIRGTLSSSLASLSTHTNEHTEPFLASDSSTNVETNVDPILKSILKKTLFLCNKQSTLPVNDLITSVKLCSIHADKVLADCTTSKFFIV